ncbi:Uncharacterised protein [Streptococcus pneumoniae]|nr:Uncharacterised protein [Streptococcus pneumoniae]CJF94093.1 Uncharacterised protein [Streptococcus pneumoniae]COK39093.1 Uncharacterised protein [Streptococcus pneumoniae]
MTECNWQWHELFCFIYCKSKHEPLVTCSNQVQWILISISTNLQGFVNTLSDVRRLFHQRWVYSHRLSRKSIFCIGITNLCNGITNHTVNIHIGICRNFTKNVDRTSIYSCFSSNVRLWILC